MQLPFLKLRSNITKPNPTSEKLVNGSDSDTIDIHLTQEIMDAIENHDVKGLRHALEAMVFNAFEQNEDKDE